MIKIEIDGDEKITYYGRRLSVQEIEGLVGGPYQIDAIVIDEGQRHYLISGRLAWKTGVENPKASKRAGKTIWGPVVLLVKGTELA